MSLGPLLQKELVVLARRRRTFWLRAGALGVLSLLMIPLLIQLAIQAANSGGMGAQSIAGILFQVFVWTQFSLLALVAPAFSAGAISYERRLGTIDLLELASIRTTSLTVGKFLGAAALPALLVVSEVPFLFIWTLFGGIGTESIFAALLLTAATTVLLIAIGLFASAVTDTAGIAMVVSYVAMLLYLAAPFWLSPLLAPGADVWFAHIALFRQLQGAGIAIVPWWKAVVGCLALAMALAVGASVFLVRSPSLQRVLDRTSIGSRVERKSRRVWGQPVLWREVTGGGGRKVARFLNLVTLVSVACFGVALIVPDDHVRNILGWITVVLPPVTGGVLGAISISLEKEGRSAAALLLLPSAATTVVLGKFAGACVRTLPLAVVPFLLGFVRMEATWMIGAGLCALLSLLLISTGTLFSTLFARTAIAVAATFGGTIFYSMCCCQSSGLLMPLMLMQGGSSDEPWMIVLVFGITAAIYGVIIATVLAIAIGMFESRAREGA